MGLESNALLQTRSTEKNGALRQATLKTYTDKMSVVLAGFRYLNLEFFPPAGISHLQKHTIASR